jgi:cardiolipin synthase
VVNDPAAVAREWATQLPNSFIATLAAALRTGPDEVRALRGLSLGTASRAAVEHALNLAKGGDGPYLAGLLIGCQREREEQPVITPVWTGPESSAGGSRLTLAVVADLIDQATAEILLVSYATAPSTEVRDALHRATDRGVEITTLLERAEDNPTFTGHPNPLAGIPARQLAWPAGAREPGASMHAKILVVDRQCALIGSANLTGYGVERNLECGVLIRGGLLPKSLVEHVLTAPGISAA